MDHFFRFAGIATGNSFIDGTKGFVQALVVCCGAVTNLAGSDCQFCIVFGIEFLAVGIGCFLLTSIGCSMVSGVVMGIDGWPAKGGLSTSCTVNVAHVLVSAMGVGSFWASWTTVH